MRDENGDRPAPRLIAQVAELLRGCEADRRRESDAVNHPAHYTAHPSGVECIQVTEHLNFCVGNAVKYLWRAGRKGDAVEDLRKARWYIDREIQRLEQAAAQPKERRDD